MTTRRRFDVTMTLLLRRVSAGVIKMTQFFDPFMYHHAIKPRDPFLWVETQMITMIDFFIFQNTYRQNPNISDTLVGNKLVDHSDVVGASPVGAAPTTSSFST